MAALDRITLASVPTGVINLAFQNRRRHRARAALQKLGLTFDFIEGIADKPRHFGCSQSHLKAVETLRGSGPFLVLEDDAIPTAHYQSHVAVPDGVDLIYLGHSPFGWSRTLNSTPELTERDSDDFLRVHSMLAAHAILYVTDAGAEAVAASIRRSMSGEAKERHDIGLCDLQQVLNVKATALPLFCQSGDLQGPAKRERRKEQEDFISAPRQAGDRVQAGKTQLTVTRTASGRLEFRRTEADEATT